MKKIILIVIAGLAIANWNQIRNLSLFSSPAEEAALPAALDHSWLEGAEGYRDALKLSEDNEQPIVIYAYADWCNYCKKFESTLLVDNEVNTTLNKFIKVKLNPDTNQEDSAIFKKLGGRGYPSLFIKRANSTSQKLKAPFYQEGSRWKILTSTQFIELLNTHHN